MEDFLYAYNQPKKFGKYDLILDGKIIANEVVYKVLTEDNDIENINLADKLKELESKSQNSFTFETVTELPTEGKESVIYLVPNGDTSDDENSYYEYLWDKTNSKFELIGSGSYEQQKAELDKEIADRIADVNAEEERAKGAETVLTDNLAKEIKDRTDADTLIRETVTSITGYPFEKITGDTLSISDELEKRVPYTLHKDVNVVGNVKDVVKLDVPESSNEAMYCPQGLIMGGSAQAAGLVTRGICGVSNPADDGYCLKENLYINYDGDTTYRNNRQLILQAGEVGDDYGHNLYQYAAARGDAVKGYVDEKIENRVVINDPITITEGDNTTSITSDTISTTTLSGTLDAESMKNSLTAEAIQNVAPIAWGAFDINPTAKGNYSIAIGDNAKCLTEGGNSISVGKSSQSAWNSTSFGNYTEATRAHSTAIGYHSKSQGNFSIALGSRRAEALKDASITIGSNFTETTPDGDVTHTCITQGTGSITIGAGANTLNNGDVESSNSVTIGCKAENKGADSVVIGASSTNKSIGTVIIGAGAKQSGSLSVAVGNEANAAYGSASIGRKATTVHNSVAVGFEAHGQTNSVGIGFQAKASTDRAIAIGSGATITSTADTLSDNTTVIGAGASASAPNAVVLGAGASGQGGVIIGAGASGNKKATVAIGLGSHADESGIAIGNNANAPYASTNIGNSTRGDGISVGHSSQAYMNGIAIGAFSFGQSGGMSIGHGSFSTQKGAALGYSAQSRDAGAIVFASWGTDGVKTQLYFSGQNTPLALKYYPTEWEKKQDVDEQGNPKVDDEGNPIMIDDKDKPTKGQAMMGYVVSKVITNDEGNQETKVLECGTNLLAALFPNHGLGDNPFQPTTTAIDDEERVTFHPSDLDLPIEEPSENNDVEINVEINIPTIETPIEEEYKPLPIYPIVEPTIDEITE